MYLNTTGCPLSRVDNKSFVTFYWPCLFVTQYYRFSAKTFVTFVSEYVRNLTCLTPGDNRTNFSKRRIVFTQRHGVSTRYLHVHFIVLILRLLGSRSFRKDPGFGCCHRADVANTQT